MGDRLEQIKERYSHGRSALAASDPDWLIAKLERARARIAELEATPCERGPDGEPNGPSIGAVERRALDRAAERVEQFCAGLSFHQIADEIRSMKEPSDGTG